MRGQVVPVGREVRGPHRSNRALRVLLRAAASTIRGSGSAVSSRRAGALAQDGHATRAHVVALAVGGGVDTDAGPGRDDDVLVQDRPADDGALTDVDAVHQHAVLDPGTALDPDTRRDDRAVHRAAADDHPGADHGLLCATAEDELGRRELRRQGVDGPAVVVEVEDRGDRPQVHVRVVVGVDRPDVTPVAVVALGGARDDVGAEVVDAGGAGVGHHRHDRAAHVVHRVLVLRVGAQGLEQRVGGEDVVAHGREALLGRAGQARRVGRLLQEAAHLALGVGVDDAELGGLPAGHAQPGDGHPGTGLQVLVDHLRRVHPVHVVGPEDGDDLRPVVVDQVQALVDRVGAAGVPARAQPLLRRDRVM